MTADQLLLVESEMPWCRKPGISSKIKWSQNKEENEEGITMKSYYIQLDTSPFNTLPSLSY